MAVDLRDVDPAELRLPSSRSNGADPVKLQRQIARTLTVCTGDVFAEMDGSEKVVATMLATVMAVPERDDLQQ